MPGGGTQSRKQERPALHLSPALCASPDSQGTSSWVSIASVHRQRDRALCRSHIKAGAGARDGQGNWNRSPEALHLNLPSLCPPQILEAMPLPGGSRVLLPLFTKPGRRKERCLFFYLPKSVTLGISNTPYPPQVRPGRLLS